MATTFEQLKQKQSTTSNSTTFELLKNKPNVVKVVEENKDNPNYLERVAQQWIKAGQDIISGIQSGASQIERGTEKNKTGFGGTLDILGGTIRSGLRTVGGVAGAAFAPITEAPGIKQGLEKVGEGIANIPGVDVLSQKLSELSQKYPEASKDIEDIINISILGGGKTIEKPIGVGLEKAGVSLEKGGLEAVDVAKNKFALDLVKPVETKATKIAQVGRTTESKGLFAKDIVTPTKFEEAMANQVAKIPGIKEGNTFQKNYNIIRDFNVNQAKQLESDIAKYDFSIPKSETISRLEVAANELKNSPLIVGDAEKTANKLIEGAKKIINENNETGSGLLKARKDYDNWVLGQKPKAFDAKSENAFTLANDTVRKTLNDLLDEKAVNLGVKDSLRQQSLLYRTMNTVGQKAAEEANTTLGRTLQRVGKVLGTKNKIVQGLAAAAGIGGLGAAATFAPAVAVLGGAGLIAYQAGKFVLKPELRIAIGRMLQTSGKFLDAGDRAILQDIIKNSK